MLFYDLEKKTFKQFKLDKQLFNKVNLNLSKNNFLRSVIKQKRNSYVKKVLFILTYLQHQLIKIQKKYFINAFFSSKNVLYIQYFISGASFNQFSGAFAPLETEKKEI